MFSLSEILLSVQYIKFLGVFFLEEVAGMEEERVRAQVAGETLP